MGPKIYFGLSDEHPVIMTSAEAWWNVRGEWICVHPAEIGNNFHEISKAQFDCYDLPDLPPSASIHDAVPTSPTTNVSKQPLLVSVETVEKFLTLSQRRCRYFEELHQSGRWRRIYSEESALQARMHSAVQDAENWAKVLRRASKKEAAPV